MSLVLAGLRPAGPLFEAKATAKAKAAPSLNVGEAEGCSVGQLPWVDANLGGHCF